MKEQFVRLTIFGAMTAHFIHATLKSELATTSWIVNTILSLWSFASCISEISFAWKRLLGGLPPGSIGYIPFVGDMIDFVWSPYKYFYSRLKQFGSPFLTHIFFSPTIHMTTSEEVAWLWNAERKGYIDVGFPFHLKRLVGPRSIIVINGAPHRSLRRLLEPAFAPASVRGYTNVMDETIQEFLNELHEQQEKDQMLLSSASFKYYTLKLFFTTVFGKGIPDSTVRQLNAEFTTFMGGMTSILPIAIPGTQFYKSLQARNRATSLIQKLVSDFKEKYNENSIQATQTLMGRLCYGTSRDNDNNSKPLSNEALSENLLIILLAGHDTTYSSLGSLLYYLSLHPDNLKALEQEVREIVRKTTTQPDKNTDKIDGSTSSSCLDYTMLKDEAPVLNAILAEVWRIAPPGPLSFMRKMNRTISHKNYTFHKGTTICFNTFLGCHDEDRYPNPEEFRIERFLSPNHPFIIEKKKSIPNETKEGDTNDYYRGIDYTQRKQCYPVFGGGNRACVGVHFAQLEMRIFLLRLVEKYRIDVKKAVHSPLPFSTWICDFTLKQKN